MNEMNAALKTTHALIGFIESSLKIRMHAEGVENIPNDRPILFVINHFTRLETFLIPRIIYQHTGRVLVVSVTLLCFPVHLENICAHAVYCQPMNLVATALSLAI